MKTIIFLALIVFYCGVTSAQDIHQPTPMTFSQPQLVDSTYQSKFFYSWNWSSGPQALNTRYKMNAFHTMDAFNNGWSFPNQPTSYNSMPDSLSLMWRIFKVWDDNTPLDALAMMWYPWLPPSSSADDFSAFRNDKTGASLPFLSRVDSLGSLDSTTSGGETMYRWKLKKDLSMTSLVNAFSQPWLGNEFIYRNLGTGIKISNGDTIRHDLYNSRQLHLTINLRRTGTDTLSNSDTLLVLRLPYRSYNGSTGYISFDSVPSVLTGSLVWTSRGKYRKVTGNNSSDLTTFVIRRNMLPRADSTNPDITLYAMFFADNSDAHGSYTNPRFNCLWCGGTGTVIDTIGIEAQYIPSKASIAIRWLKIETPNAKRAYFGGYDSVMKREINRTLDSLRSYDSIWNKHHKVFRFYTREEFLASEWQSVRYFNLLVDTLASTEYEVRHRGQEENTMLLRENWNGKTFQITPGVPAPYVRQTWAGIYDEDFDSKALGTANRDGYVNMTGLWLTKRHNDYEAAFRGMPYEFGTGANAWSTESSKLYSLPLPAMTDSAYRYDILRANGLDATYQYPSVLQAMDGFLSNYHYYSDYSYVFSTKPWWGNIWVSNAMSYNFINPNSTSPYHLRTAKALPGKHRSFTGEELRYTMWSNLILGAKGFHLWHGGTADGLDTMYNDPTTKEWEIHLSLAPTGDGFLPTDSSITTDQNLILEDTDIGTDYLDTTGGRTDMFTQIFRRYFKYSDSTYRSTMGMDRIYLGMRSQRWVVDEVFSHNRTIDTTLMNLQLVSWYAKGIRQLSFGNMSLLGKYIDTTMNDTSNTKFSCTRINDGFKESWDSSFYDVTLHKHKFYDTNKIVYLGIQNRRTNSLLKSGGDTIWIPTKEFNDSVATGGRQKYEQFGARELRIPFNYIDTNGRYALLKITELGGGVDTVIGQDRSLAVKFLPGEGKMFKVEVLRPNDVSGELAHSNQTKIVAHALMRRSNNGTGPWIESDTIVQYMTYHKQIPGRVTGWTGVYFRKSKPANKYMNTAAPQWEEEHLVSDSVFHDSVWAWCDTCAYPSIVTRFDSTSLEYRSYIVYSCVSDTIPGQDYNQQYIVESVVRVGNDTVIKGNLQGKVMGWAGSRDMKEWGTPMVNASDTANFYCWSQPYYGIVAGWKKPDSIPVPLVSAIGIYWTNLVNEDCIEITAQHPSMNPYSRYIRGEGESDCAIVWQEKNDCTVALEHIFYTRLRIEDGQIVYGLSPHYGVDPMVGGIFNGDTSIVCMSTTVNVLDSAIASHTFPVVYRELFHADSDTSVCNFDTYYPGHTPADVRFDGVFWQYKKLVTPDTNPIPIPLTNISSRWIWQRDTVSGGFVPDSLRLGWIGILWSNQNQYFLDQPVVSAGEAYYYPTTENWSGCVNYSTRVTNLNFRMRPMTIYKPSWNHTIYDSLAEILHLPQTHQYPHDPYIPVSIVDRGYLSNAHLAERGTLKLNDWQRNHRIYNKRVAQETTPEPTPPIRTSGQYFFKTSNGQQIARQIHSFGDDSLSFGIASVVVRGREYAVSPKKLSLPYPILVAPDTLSSNWFTVDYFEELRLVTTGNAPEKLKALLERRSDGALWDFTCNAGEKMKLTDELIDLYDGSNEEYRVRVCSNEGAPYRSETAITTDEETASYKRSETSNKSINLGSGVNENVLMVFPNPAREHVTIQLQKNIGRRVVVRVLSALGHEIAKNTVIGRVTWSVATNTLPAGMYSVIVQAEETGLVLATDKFVIMR